jgi:hypothetical protein
MSQQPIKKNLNHAAVPDSKPRPTGPEIPPEEDTPEKDAAIKAS